MQERAQRKMKEMHIRCTSVKKMGDDDRKGSYGECSFRQKPRDGTAAVFSPRQSLLGYRNIDSEIGEIVRKMDFKMVLGCGECCECDCDGVF